MTVRSPPFDICAAVNKEKDDSQNRESPHFFHLWSNMWSSQTYRKTKSLVNIKFTRLFELALPTRLVGVTGFEPALALPSRTDLTSSSHVVSALRHSLSADTPCFVGKNFEKTPHRGVFPSFSLDPGFVPGRGRWFNRNAGAKRKRTQKRPFLFGRSDWI